MYIDYTAVLCLTNACSGTALDTEITINNLSLPLVAIIFLIGTRRPKFEIFIMFTGWLSYATHF